MVNYFAVYRLLTITFPPKPDGQTDRLRTDISIYRVASLLIKRDGDTDSYVIRKKDKWIDRSVARYIDK